MSRILLRAHKDPFRVAGPEETIREGLIGNNVGNLIFSQSVYRLLSTADNSIRTSSLRGRKESIAGHRFQGTKVDRLILPLANAFRPPFVRRLEQLSDQIENLRVPVTVLGVGAQATLRGRQARADLTGRAVTRFVRAALSHSDGPIGVRGDFTRSYLRDLGFGDQDVTVIGCPSMFMYGPDLRLDDIPDTLDHEAPIALNITPHVAAMGPLSRRHAERYPRLVYLAQNQPTLEFLLTGRYPAEPASSILSSGVPVSLEHPLIREDRIRFFLDPTTWINHLSGYDFSFGSRIHGNIAAILAGTPAVVLAHDARTLELAEYHQIPHHVITDHPRRIDAASLYADADWRPLIAGHGPRWQAFCTFLDQHGLRTVYSDGEDRGAQFDRELAAINFPAPIRTPIKASPEELFALRRELSELRNTVARLEAEKATAAASTRPSAVSRSTIGRVRRQVGSSARRIRSTLSPEHGGPR